MSSILIRRANMIAGGVSPRLPAGYTELAYLETDGSSFIDTGIKGLYVDRVKGKASFSSLSSAVIYAVGGRATSNPSSTATGYALYSSSHNGFTYYPQVWRTGVGESITAGQVVSFDTYIGTSSQTFSVNGTQLDSASVSVNKGTSGSEGSRTLYLFGIHSGESTCQYCVSGTKIYGIQMFFEGNKIADYVPAKRDSDSVVGMYDLVSNAFLTNAGTGTFSYGTL